MNSPLILGDGFHNSADILESLGVMWLLYFTRQGPSQKYPFGRKDVEYALQALTGLVLLWPVWEITRQSFSGLANVVPGLGFLGRLPTVPAYEPLSLDPRFAILALLLMATSTAASYVVGRYQIRLGREHGSPGLLSNGQETLSDGRIELSVCVSIAFEYLLHLAVIEYLFGLFIAYKILRTAIEIGWEGIVALYHRITHHAISAEEETEVRLCAESVYGVQRVSELKTFMIGDTVVVIMKVESICSTESCGDIKAAIAGRLRNYFAAKDLQCDWYIRFSLPDPDRHRQAFPLSAEGLVTSHLVGAARLRICEMERGRALRTTDEVMPETIGQIMALLKLKRIREVRSLPLWLGERAALRTAGIAWKEVASQLPENIGIAAPV
jgi:cation diffusion facilitator family transporter